MLGRGGTDIMPTFILSHSASAPKCRLSKPAAVSVLTLLLSTAGKSLPSKAIATCLSLSEKAENGSGQVAWRIAVGGIVRPLRSGQDNGFVQTLQREGEEVGGGIAIVSVPCNTKMPS